MSASATLRSHILAEAKSTISIVRCGCLWIIGTDVCKELATVDSRLDLMQILGVVRICRRRIRQPGLTWEGGSANPFDPSPWAHTTPGNVNLYALHNFGSVALNDAAIIGKSITKDFYSQPPRYSYFSGCSGGGRQAMMLAQRYPDAYNGIVAGAPAMNWPEFFVAMY